MMTAVFSDILSSFFLLGNRPIFEPNDDKNVFSNNLQSENPNKINLSLRASRFY
jgi:hypothetical protein